MGRMYIANLTNQHQVVAYRLPESKNPVRLTIPIGRQVPVAGSPRGDAAGELSPTDIGAIVSQNAPYGLRNVAEIDRAKQHTGLVYSLDKPVSQALMEKGIRHNLTVLRDRGKKIREESAVALMVNLEEQTSAMAQTDVTVRKLEVETTEETRDSRDESPVFAEGTRVQREEGQQVAPPSKRATKK